MSELIQNIDGLLPSDAQSLLTSASNAQYTNVVMSGIQLLMLLGFGILKLKKRLRTNEEKVEIMERKMSHLMRNRVTEL